MTNKLKFTLSFIALMISIQCSKTKVQYFLPENISKENKKNLTAYFDRGKDLFKTNCSSCHGIFNNGKDSIPNFTTTQIETYKAKIALKDGQTHAFTDSLSYEQIEQILHFLSYRKQ